MHSMMTVRVPAEWYASRPCGSLRRSTLYSVPLPRFMHFTCAGRAGCQLGKGAWRWRQELWWLCVRVRVRGQ